MTKILLIVNPEAGMENNSQDWHKLEKELLDVGADVSVKLTEKIYDATKIAAKTGFEFDIVCACGGDGTLSEVASGLMFLEKKPYLAFFAVGSTCDVAKTFNLSSDPHKACETILYGPTFAIDIANIGGSEAYIRQDLPEESKPPSVSLLPKHFTYVASFGIFTETSYATPRNLKKTLGHFAYFLNGIKSLSSIESIPMRISRHGRITEDEFIFGALANSSSLGGFFDINGARFDDGKFELLLIRTPSNLVQLAPMLHNLNQNKEDQLVIREKVSACEFEFLEQAGSLTIDGEYGGTRELWRFSNQTRALDFKVPELPHFPSHNDSVKDVRPR